MRTALVVVVVLALSSAALGGQHPFIQTYIQFQNSAAYPYWRVDPKVGETVRAYVVMWCFDTLVDYPGMTSIWLRLEITPGMADNPRFNYDQQRFFAWEGDWESGINLVAWSGCVGLSEPQETVIVGALVFEYTGVPGNVKIIGQPDYPGRVSDCQQPVEWDYYCVYWDGGVGRPHELIQICDCYYAGSGLDTDTTWGTIKALYRP